MIQNAGATLPSPTYDTIELARLIGQAGLHVTLDEGRTYRIRSASFAAGVTLEIPATTVVEVIDDGTATSRSLRAVDVEGVTITGEGTIRGTSTTRTGVYGLVYAEHADDLIVEGITLHTSPAAGLFTYGGDGTILRNLSVHDTGADGLHLTRGATNFEITNCTTTATGDDGISVIAVYQTGPTVHGVCGPGMIALNTVTNVTLGRGIIVSGCVDTSVHANTIDGIDQAGIIVSAQFGDPTGENRSADVVVRDNGINNIGRDVIAFGVGHGIYVTYSDGVAVTFNHIDNAPYDGIRLVDVTSTDLSESENTFGTVAGGDVVHQ